MPGLAQRNEQFSNGSSQTYSLSSANGFWSKHRDEVDYNQLQKFWTELSPRAQQELLRIDKQTLFEQARKNLYCSRCNGLLLEGFLQIVMYGKSLQQEGASGHLPRTGALRNQNDVESSIVNGCQDEIQDPSVHPWGGLTTTREGSLTLMDCYLYSKSLKGLQNVFDSARARERERELLYPDACGGGGRGWISQGLVGYGRGHGTRETCALHTARLSCDTLVDFWSALGEETRQSLLRMKEEDFIERLMYRFDSKRFCRDCRRNVIREFKELKELKRMRREPRCTSWFCVADTAFQYEVSDDTVYADWHQTFADAAGTYHHFEWAVGTGEGKADILDFENVGMNGSVNVDGLDLSGLSACFITLRAWKLDGRCTELSVKAHALKGGQCVHGRLVVGDGFVTITRGESIRRFFEHAEEAEEEEDDDSMDKDGNDLDGECSRPQKHAKSPELAREFLLDAATVIFKEQVEKAFREGTARQNAHSIFVCLALKLLEERVHVACKEIITLEKQMKLLEEEEKEKREEEERKERRRTKEREKKLRRKERLKGKEKDKDKNSHGQYQSLNLADMPKEESSVVVDEEPNNSISCSNSSGEAGNIVQCRPGSPNARDDKLSNGFLKHRLHNSSHDHHDGELNTKDSSGSFTGELTQYSRRKSKTDVPVDAFTKWSERFKRDQMQREQLQREKLQREQLQREQQRCAGDNFESPKTVNGSNKQSRVNGTKSNSRCGAKFCEKFHCSSNGRINDRYVFHSCSCNQNTEYRAKIEPHVSTVRINQEARPGTKSESALDISKQLYHGHKYNQTDHARDSCGRPKTKFISGNPSSRDLQPKKVWEPLESQKKYARSNSDSDFTLKSSALKVNGTDPNNSLIKSSDGLCSDKNSIGSLKVDDDDNDSKDSTNSTDVSSLGGQNGLHLGEKDPFNSNERQEKKGLHLDHSVNFMNSTSDGSSDPIVSASSSSDNCSSCLSEEGDSNTASSNLGNHESSSSSDSEDSSVRSEGKETSDPIRNDVSGCHRGRMEINQISSQAEPLGGRSSASPSQNGAGSNVIGTPPLKVAHAFDNGFSAVNMGSQHPGMLPPLHNQNLPFPVFQTTPTLGYYHQNPVSWPAAPSNGLLPFSHPNQYLYAGPLGYGMNGDSRFCVPYGPMQHLATPLYTHGPLPFYQPIAKANVISPEEKTPIPKPQQLQEAPNVATVESTDRIGLHSTQAASSGERIQSEDSGKKHVRDTSFSLFHFGGPVALSTGCQPNPLPPKEEIVGDYSSMCPTDHVDDKSGCYKKETTVEEYNLFAASNGIKFSFF